jgi:hypothetical protein
MRGWLGLLAPIAAMLDLVGIPSTSTRSRDLSSASCIEGGVASGCRSLICGRGVHGGPLIDSHFSVFAVVTHNTSHDGPVGCRLPPSGVRWCR